jgi:hypothetical protein
MLVLNDLEKVKDDVLKDMLTQFRKAQVSRYPIETYMGMNSEMVGFVDSRFPTTRFSKDDMLAMVWTDTAVNRKNERVTEYVIESRLIHNEKYARHNSDFYTRKTTDPKKFAKYLKDYVKPFSYQEVAMRSMRLAEGKFDDWKGDKRREAYHTVNVNWNDIMEEITKLQALGVKPQTEKFRKAYEVGIPAYEEYKGLENKSFKRIHVFAHTDGTVAVSSFADYGDIQKGSTLYEEMSFLPQHIQEQVGMLRMMSTGDFVPNIGMKINDREFWVEGLSQ